MLIIYCASKNGIFYKHVKEQKYFLTVEIRINVTNSCLHTCASILQHCCSNETGGLPRLVASCTRSNCSFCVGLFCIECNMATAANQVERESGLNKPPQRS